MRDGSPVGTKPDLPVTAFPAAGVKEKSNLCVRAYRRARLRNSLSFTSPFRHIFVRLSRDGRPAGRP